MKLFGKILLGAVGLAVVLLLVSVIHHYQLRAAVEHYQAERKATGTPMELSQVLSPPIDPEKNGTVIFQQLIAALEKDGANFEPYIDYFPVPHLMVAPGKALIPCQQPDVRNDDATNSWAELQAKLDRARPELNLLLQLPDHPEFDFQLHYELGWKAYAGFTNLYLVQMRSLQRLLNAAVLMDLHKGDGPAAIKDTQAILALVKAAESQHFMVSELVGTAILLRADIWEILQSPQVSDPELASLQQDLQRIDLPSAYTKALDMERLCIDVTLHHNRHSDVELQQYLHIGDGAYLVMGGVPEPPSWFNKVKTTANIFWWRYWWSYADELNYRRGFKILRDSAENVRTNSNFRQTWATQQLSLEQGGFTNPRSFFTEEMDFHTDLSCSIASLAGAFSRLMTTETAQQIDLTAIALKRYDLQHGEYPENLAQLVPTFLATVPLDTMNGEPLHYRRQTKETFLLYSVGENGVDDGGDPSVPPDVKASSSDWQNGRARDWVWPQVATPAEIAKFCAHPPK